MGYKLLFFSIFLFTIRPYGSVMAQNSTSETSFSLSPNDLGALQNSVNLYTGQVAFPMTIASLPGRGGLAPRLVINYNSAGVQKKVSTWNREAPTGITGLGWSLTIPKIAADHNGTSTRHDDKFYLIEDGQSVRLYCTDPVSTLSYRTYKTEIYQPWDIKYYPDLEKWVIIRDEGTMYIYGDNERPKTDGTIQNMIAWGNWIGSSNNRSGQKEVAYTWNLSEIQNFYDDKLTYYYENVEESLGLDPNPGDGNDPMHTKASYLRRIVGPTGNYIQMHYNEKEYQLCPTSGDFRCTTSIREYQDPNVEINEPDAYQEKYESKYLSKIEAFDEKGLPLYDVNLTYNEDDEGTRWLGEGEFAKRLLTGIEQINYTGAALPKSQFSYVRDNVPEKGYLQVVDNSIGGKIQYQYENTAKKIGRICFLNICRDRMVSDLAAKGFPAESPGEGWIEPNLFIGPNYVIVIWRYAVALGFVPAHTRNPRPSYLQIYEWTGEWVKHDVGDIGQLRLSHDIDKQELVVALQKDHFALALRQGTNDYRINVFHKDKFNGNWTTFSDHVTLYDGRLADAQYLSELYLHSGRDYVLLGNMTSPFSYRYTWNGASWDKDQLNYTPEDPSGMHYASSDNFVLAHNINTSPDEFSFHLLSEDKNWTTSVFDADFRTDAVYSDQKREDRSYWYSTPSFMVAMADDNPEYAFVLEESYISHTRFSLPALGDHYPVVTPSNGNINISAHPAGEFENFNNLFFFRYDGTVWKEKIIQGAGILGFYIGPKLYNSAPDVVGFSLGESTLRLMRYDANLGDWAINQYTTPVNWLDRYVKISTRSALMGDQIYYLEPNGVWQNIGGISITGLNGSSWYEDLRSVNDLYAVSKPYDYTRFYKITNGTVVEKNLLKNMDRRTDYYDVGDRLMGGSIMAAFDVEDARKAGARKFHLYKWEDNEFQGGYDLVVVSNVKVNDGILDIKKAYSYNTLTAKVDASGQIPLFNEVTVVTGSDDAINYPKGYTKHYFYNGKPLSELVKVPANQIDDDVTLFAGSNYRMEMYDNAENLVTSNETVYSTTKKVLYNSSSNPFATAYFVRPTQAVTKDYFSGGNVRSLLTETSYNQYGYPTLVENYSDDQSFSAHTKNSTAYTYYSDVYDPAAQNIYSEIVSTKTLVDDEVVSSEATVWQEINDVPLAIKSYTWRGFGSVDFTAWTGSEPGTSWRLSNKVEHRDSKGNILQSSDFMGDREAAIYDDLQLNPTLSATYALYDQIAGTSFEPGQMGYISTTDISTQDAYTGESCLYNGSATSPVLPTDDYEVYYWYKNDIGSVSISSGTSTDHGVLRTSNGWSLRKWSLSGSGLVTISTSSYLDELRIHPENAYTTTFVYNQRQQKIAETGPDLITTFFYYDDYDRQHYIKDFEGNIVLYYAYGFKKFGE
ncbi:MAG: hypothetical protein AAF519_02655 [Bacteroidota bacterium]